MSFSTNRKAALDPNLPLQHRLSHVRSCAMLVGQKYKVSRSAILDHVRAASAIDLTTTVAESELIEAIRVLELIKKNGLTATQS
jgi:hypothetical protein